ncbi:MAG: alpha/beta hydrolase-fold protein, partial [Pseudomonadota bacterium]
SQAPPGQRPPSVATAHTMESAVLGMSVPFHIYLPPSYRDNEARRYPVIYWLHGTNGNSARGGAMIGGLFDRLMKAGRIPEAIVAFPDGLKTSMWVNSADGAVPMERFIMEEFVPMIDAQYRTIATPSGRLIEGGSMGGYGAGRLGLKYVDTFGAVSMLSPGPLQPVLDPENAPIVGRDHATRMINDVYGGDLDYFRAQSPWHLATTLNEEQRHGMRLRMIVGASDPVLPFNKQFSAHLDTLGVPHTLTVIPDVGHDPRAFFMALARSDVYVSFFAELAPVDTVSE